MNAFQKVLGGAALAVLLAAGLAAPAMAQKLDNKKNPPPVATAVTGDVDFGDDSSQWANDGECDDPRFEGAGSAAELVDDDILKDATDCRAAFTAGTVTLKAVRVVLGRRFQAATWGWRGWRPAALQYMSTPPALHHR